MTETELTMPMKFEETNFFIISPNPKVATWGFPITCLSHSNRFMGIVRSVLVIFDTGATYSCSSNKEDFVKLEKKTFPKKTIGIVILVSFVFDTGDN